MNLKNPKLTALRFNDCINDRGIDGLSKLMTEAHTLVDRGGKVRNSKSCVTRCWMEFFRMFPDYRNFFGRVESRDDLVVILGYAFWSAESPFDPAIWTARIQDDLVAEWRIYEDSIFFDSEL